MWLADNTYQMVCCVSVLAEFVEVPPDAGSYVIKARTRQWPDGSGCCVLMRWHNGIPKWLGDKGRWRLIYNPCNDLVRKLGVTETPKQIWFRLEYEE